MSPVRLTAVLVLTAALTVGSVAAPAGAKKKKAPKKVTRTAEATYDSPALGSRDLTGICSGSNGCAMFGVGSGERYLTLEIEDMLGTPVAATIGQDTDSSNATVEVVGRICGRTEEPLVIEPGVQVTVWVWVAPAVTAPACAGTASSGVVTATFPNLP